MAALVLRVSCYQFLLSSASPCAHCCYSVAAVFHSAPTSAASCCSDFNKGASEAAVPVAASSLHPLLASVFIIIPDVVQICVMPQKR